MVYIPETGIWDVLHTCVYIYMYHNLSVTPYYLIMVLKTCPLLRCAYYQFCSYNIEICCLGFGYDFHCFVLQDHASAYSQLVPVWVLMYVQCKQ